jgi:hypothetical protein
LETVDSKYCLMLGDRSMKMGRRMFIIVEADADTVDNCNPRHLAFKLSVWLAR